MTDDEYREYLTALASVHLSAFWWRDIDAQEMNHDVERLASLARFLWVVKERCDNRGLLTELATALAQETRPVDHCINAMERTGILAALSEAPEVTFENLRRSVIPPKTLSS